jgi:CRP-like cAMP-binding protein
MNPMERLKKEIDERKLWAMDIELKRNDSLIREGMRERYIYYVLQGSLRVVVCSEQEEHTIRFGYKGSFITALDSFLSGKPTTYSIYAIKKAHIKAIEKDTFMHLVENGDNAQWYVRVMEGLVLQQMERELDLLTDSPIERYHRVLARSPHLFQEIPNKYIAAYLRMTPETLSRLKKS